MQVEKPVFIIGSYRGGTSLLFRLLSESKELWSMYRESNHIWQSYHRDLKESSDTVYFEELENGNFLNTNTNEEIKDLEEKKILMDLAYHYSTYNSYILGYLGRVKLLREGVSWVLDLINYINYIYKVMNIVNYRIVDKTPPNIFRIDFLANLYPDAKFIYLTRDGNDNINSLISAWCHKSKFQYPYRKYLGGNLKLKDCDSKVWKFFIPKGFKEENYKDQSIASVCSDQWLLAHEAAQRSFEKIDSSRFIQVKFEDLLSRPKSVMKDICSFIDIDFSKKLEKIIEEMPPVNTDTKQSKSKSTKKQNNHEFEEKISKMQSKLGYNQNSYAI
jgi:hypothetical protein